MKIKNKAFIYIVLIAILAFLIWIGRGVLPPFIMAATFAYLLNPLASFLARRIKLPRVLAIAVIYFALIGTLVFVLMTVGANLAEESELFSQEAKNILHEASLQIGILPLWLQPVALDLLSSARTSFVVGPRNVASFLPGIVNGTVNILVFLVAAFYFLKDGHKFVHGFIDLFPEEWRPEIDVVLKKINKTLGDFLRAQLLLVAIMSILTYISLSILGVKYALVLSIFTGFAEIIPFVGPMVAAGLAMLVAYMDGVSSLGMDPVVQMAVVGIVYTVLRQLEDLFVIPNVLGRMTKLHPLVVLFTVLFGGHLFGVLGFVLAVPIVASVKVVLEHFLEYN